MKNTILIIGMFFITCGFMYSQSVIGKWKMVDDVTGEAKSIIEIYERSGKVYGKVADILRPEKKKDLCTACSGEDKNKPILGMVIIKNLSKDGAEYNGGTIIDPSSGKTYKCYIALESEDKLKVRGFLGIAVMGRTQYWYRIKN